MAFEHDCSGGRHLDDISVSLTLVEIRNTPSSPITGKANDRLENSDLYIAGTNFINCDLPYV